jgi:hypothetical protein
MAQTCVGVNTTRMEEAGRLRFIWRKGMQDAAAEIGVE